MEPAPPTCNLAQCEAAASRDSIFELLVEHSLAGHFALQNGLFIYVNRRFAEIFGYTPEEIIGRLGPSDLTTESQLPEERKTFLRAMGDPGFRERFRRTSRRKDGTLVDVDIDSVRHDLNGLPTVIGTVIDITDRLRAQQQVQESETRLRLALDAAKMGSFDWNMVTGRILWSANHELIFGLQPGSFGGDYAAFARLVVPEDLPGIEKGLAEAIAAKQPYNGEFRAVWSDGSIHWINAQGQFTFGSDGRPLRMLGVVAETTERKQTEAALHAMSAHVLQVQDQERRRISRELHDTTAQHLAALSLALSNLKRAAAHAGPTVTQLCEDALQMANQAAQEVRTQSYLLHPPLLEALGLAGAVEDYARGFAARSGIRLDLGDLSPIGRLSDEQELALFRVVQESLSNVLRHSGSETAAIRCTATNGWVTLEISDSGCGLSASELALFQRSGIGLGVGLSGMRERLLHIGGRLELQSGPAGTTVRALLPSAPNP